MPKKDTRLDGAKKLEALIEERALRFDEAATEIGISPYYVRQICAGRMVPGRNAQIKIAEWSAAEKGRRQEPRIALADWMSADERRLLGGKSS
ncbi:hypothetical protein [Sorangium sp. So ce233]|uniref:hypothetical protein n=1 Tax=Sorangium sp. So ce233 TaxID=3133290 RepID=UPI003F5FD6C6